MNNCCVLSTKKLKSHQKQLLLDAGFSVLENDFIQIQTLPFSLQTTPNLLLFTSQNAVQSVTANTNFNQLKDIPAICVGSVTRKMLESLGFTVLETKEYASELAPIIQQKYTNKHIAFFAGNLRRDVLPNAMQQANIKYDEYLVYQNSESSFKITTAHQAVLFYSPSGVNSYLKQNTITNQTCFCIGTTTADALQGITNNIVIAQHQTIDAVVLQCINYYKK
ncbi:uroporphyrinogen-III synthase [Flavobacterium agricola]|uniref:Uroporphyrinogen-III synthase n=1 Tax=Flavobacterium agricola TaxID=2870839 RepID=A0ABY6LZE4_9FLAO|nr:uroporphyrinogen-III synthase [Flavobacterium agricola]UYW00927.1 uroporphyrinogen-III synthase [Flavobacterium agricola]